MKHLKAIQILFAATALLLAASLPTSLAAAAPPGILNHQGVINADGLPFNGTGAFKFALVDAAGTTPYWSNDGTSTTGDEPTAAVALAVSNGRYSVALGDTGIANMTAAIPASVFADNVAVFLRVWFDDGVNGSQLLAPDQRLAAVGYALAAGRVEAANISGTLGVAQLPSTIITNGASGVNISGSFTGDGSGLTSLDSASLTGTLTTTPVHLRNIGHTNNGGSAWGVAVAGNYAYLANDADGLRIYDIATPSNPFNVGHTNNGGFGLARGVAVSGNYAYLANGIVGLWVYDISNPTNVINVSHTNNGAAALSVAVSGNYAYLANDTDGLRVYDISDPANPVNVGHIDNGGLARGVAVSGNYAYLANQGDGLRVYDISDPANPVNVGHIDNGGLARGVAVSGNYAYLANDTDGLRVYDVSGSVSAPNFLGNFMGGGSGLTGIDLGAQTTTQTLDLSGHDITNAGTVTATAFVGDGSGLTGIDLGAQTATQALDLSGNDITNAGTVTATAFVGDGSGLTGTGDNLGNHTATQPLNLNGNYLSGDGDAEGVYVDTNGKVGIGLNSPSQALEVAGNIQLNAADPFIMFYDDTGDLGTRRSFIQTVFRANFRAPAYTDADQEMDFHVSNNSGTSTRRVMTLRGVGRVGIGTNSPANMLTVSGDANVTGQVGIGTASPDRPLTIHGSGEVSELLGLQDTNGVTKWHINFNHGGLNFAETDVADDRLFLTTAGGGRVGIGTHSPGQKLTVIGNILATDNMFATAFISTSDRNAKENFNSISPADVLAKVAALPISEWNFKTDAQTTHIGPMAQDFYAAFGVGPDDRHIATVDADGVALAAIQGLNEKVEARSQNAEVSIQELKARLENLEQLLNHKWHGGAK